MPRFRPSELMSFLKERGLAPKKGLSQNFLIDGNILKKIIECAQVAPGDVVLEIGPGPGALTEQLLLAGAQVIAVEKDRQLAAALPELAESIGCADALQVHTDDILAVSVSTLLKKALKEGKKAKVIANLPYHLSSPILAQLVPLHSLISEIVVMVQDEMARRMAANPGGKDYGSFSAFLQFHCQLRRYAFKVNRRSFMPAPKVDSAIAQLSLQVPPSVSDPDAFLAMVRQAFQQKRKMLRRSLGDIYGSETVCVALESLNLAVTTRPEDLDIEQFLSLYEKLNS